MLALSVIPSFLFSKIYVCINIYTYIHIPITIATKISFFSFAYTHAVLSHSSGNVKSRSSRRAKEETTSAIVIKYRYRDVLNSFKSSQFYSKRVCTHIYIHIRKCYLLILLLVFTHNAFSSFSSFPVFVYTCIYTRSYYMWRLAAVKRPTGSNEFSGGYDLLPIFAWVGQPTRQIIWLMLLKTFYFFFLLWLFSYFFYFFIFFAPCLFLSIAHKFM